MGQHLARLTLLTLSLGGCSLLYDPDRLAQAADAPPPPLDIRPCELKVTALSPTILVEGMGAGGSRPALLVISGENLVNQNTSVSISAVAGSSRTPLVEIDQAKLEVGEHAEQLAVPIALPVDVSLQADEVISLDVQIKQDCADGPVTAMISGQLTLKGLGELPDGAGGTTISLGGGVHEYSRIDVGAAMTIVPAPNQTQPIILRSTSSVKIASTISVGASLMPMTTSQPSLGGPAGGKGGLGGQGLGGVGTPGLGPLGGQPSGGPGGFNVNDLGLGTLNEPNRGSGGAGGDGAVVGGRGGRGGGGGGSIEISAGGTLEVGKISAVGIAGEGGALGGANGGGGSGGVVLLRAGGTLIANDIDVRGGGTGARGRARYDAGGTAMVSQGELGTDHYRGPMFVELPLTSHTATVDLMAVGKPLSAFRYFVLDEGGGASQLFDAMFGTGGVARLSLQGELKPGANQICLVVDGASGTSDTRNCVEIAYLR